MPKSVNSDLDFKNVCRGINHIDPSDRYDISNRNYVDNFKHKVIDDHFYGQTLSTRWTTVFNGGILIVPGSANPNSSVGQSAFGILGLDSGNRAAGLACIHSGGSSTYIGGVVHSFGGRFRIPTLSSAAQRFIVRIGLSDTAATGEPTNGVFLRYSDNVNSGRFQLVCRNTNTETAFDTGVAAVANTWVNFRIEINAAGAVVGVYLTTGNTFPATLLGTITTGSSIPSGSTALGLFAMIAKTVGGTARQVELDEVFYDLRTFG